MGISILKAPTKSRHDPGNPQKLLQEGALDMYILEKYFLHQLIEDLEIANMGTKNLIPFRYCLMKTEGCHN